MTGAARGALGRAAIVLAGAALVGATALPAQPFSPPARAATTAVAVAADLTGAHTLTVLPVWWDTSPDATTSELATAAATAAAFWENQSGGRLDVVPVVRPWVRISAADVPGCDPAALAAAAAAADPAGARTSPTRHLVLHVPANDVCRARATDSASPTVLVGRPRPGTLEHAAGHAFGLGDADTLQCTDASGWQTSLSNTCARFGGADRTDVMGTEPRPSPPDALGPVQLDHLGWLGTADVDLWTLVSPRVVRLHARGDGVRALRIPLRPGDADAFPGAVLYVDYRPDAAPDAPGWQGVRLQLDLPDRSGSSTLTAHPTRLPARADDWDPDGWTAPALQAGQLWNLPGTDVLIGVDDADGDTATVTVGYDGMDLVPPTAATVTTPGPRESLAPGSDVTWTPAADDGSGVGGYRVFIDGTQEASVTPDLESMPLPVLAIGRHTVRVDAFDRAGHETRGTDAVFLVPANDVVVPTIAAEPSCEGRRCNRVLLLVRADPRFDATVSVDGEVRTDLLAADDAQFVDAGPATAATSTVTVTTRSRSGRLLDETSMTYTADVDAPTAPGRVRAVPDLSTSWPLSVHVTWPAASDDVAVAGYLVTLPGSWERVYVSARDETGEADVGTFAGPGRLCAEVSAVDAAGNESPAASGCFWADWSPPAAGRLAVRAVDRHHAALTWTAATDPDSGIAWYQVLRNGRAYGPRIAPAGRARWTRTVTVPAGRTRVGVRVADRVGLTTDLTKVVTTR